MAMVSMHTHGALLEGSSPEVVGRHLAGPQLQTAICPALSLPLGPLTLSRSSVRRLSAGAVGICSSAFSVTSAAVSVHATSPQVSGRRPTRCCRRLRPSHVKSLEEWWSALALGILPEPSLPATAAVIAPAASSPQQPRLTAAVSRRSFCTTESRSPAPLRLFLGPQHGLQTHTHTWTFEGAEWRAKPWLLPTQFQASSVSFVVLRVVPGASQRARRRRERAARCRHLHRDALARLWKSVRLSGSAFRASRGSRADLPERGQSGSRHPK